MQKIVLTIMGGYIAVGALHGLVAPMTNLWFPLGWTIDCLFWPLQYIIA